MRKLIMAAFMGSATLTPWVAVPMAGAPALAQDDCRIVQNADGSGSYDCSSNVAAAITPPPPADSSAIRIDPPQPPQCQSFHYRVLPNYPPQCSVRGSYVDAEGDNIYVLRCCG